MSKTSSYTVLSEDDRARVRALAGAQGLGLDIGIPVQLYDVGIPVQLDDVDSSHSLYALDDPAVMVELLSDALTQAQALLDARD